MRIGFAPKSILELNYKKYKETFDPQNMVQIPAGLEHVFASYSNFCEVCEKKKEKEKNEETFTKFCSLVSCEQLNGFLSNSICGVPCMENNFTANLVEFG